MNTYSFIAGLIAASATLGHFTIGINRFLKPFLSTQLDQIVKVIFLCIFRYVSIFLLLSSFVLIMVGIRGSDCSFDPVLALGFIGGNYIIFGLTHLITILLSDVKKNSIVMYQWVLWIIIGVLCFFALNMAYEYVNAWK